MTDVKNPIVVKDNPFSSEYDFQNPEYKVSQSQIKLKIKKKMLLS
jgi:hypothetical protein